VVAVDPSGNTGEGDKHAECGIIVVARCADGHAYLLSDASAKLSPERWAQRAVDLYYSYRADRIVAEKNFGGQMVESTIRMVNQSAKVQLVQASRGKAIRAEPVACLYEQQRVHHVGVFPQLEEQMCSWTPTQNGPSPDRLNALVWGVSELLVEGSVWT
jgi:phage terminase large subunit-like protein